MMGSVEIAFRTHVWNEAVEFAWQRLLASTRHPISLLVDETNGPVSTPTTHRVISHTAGTFSAMGLPLLPDARRALWFNGDYPLYQLLERSNAENLVMIEGDCAVFGSLDALIDGLIDEGVDLSTKNYGPRSPKHEWAPPAKRWFGETIGAQQIFGGMFPLVFISRRALIELKAARLNMSARVGGDAERWVFCETFTATHLTHAGYKCRRFGAIADTARYSPWIPVHINDPSLQAKVNGLTLVHPVLKSPNFEQKMVDLYPRMQAAIEKSEARRKKLIRHVEKLTEENLSLQAALAATRKNEET